MFSFLTELKTGKRLVARRFDVIFYAENRFYFQYFRHLYETLASLSGITIAYITSDKTDPVLEDSRVEAVYLKSTLAGIFPRLQAGVVIMSMPDLQNFIIKKSPSVGKYIYVFHALVSTHQQYRSRAFDHYDALLCTGPQLEEEIRKGETLYDLPPRECIYYGYPLIEDLKRSRRNKEVRENKVLIAPSWYNEGILNTCIVPLVDQLAKADMEIWIRPHPEFIKRNKATFEKLVKRSREFPHLHFDRSPFVYTHLSDAGLLVTDRSGIGLEYALAARRPVLFIDTPLKIQNPEVARFGIEPLENRVRHQLGISVLPTELYRLKEAIDLLRQSLDQYQISIAAVEEEIVFPRTAWENGIHYIQRQLGR